MNNKSSGIGCTLLVLLAVIFYIVQGLISSPWTWTFVAVVGVLIFLFRRMNKQNNQAKLTEALNNTAKALDDIANGKVEDLSVGLSLQKGEKLIYSLPDVALTEYQSTGSSYSGMNAGVSFPLIGSLRGNVGGQGGQITRNPEQLMAVDQGRVFFTDQRIIFSGAKLVRDWDLAKTIELAPGPNGFNVKIAVSNRERTSGLQALSIYEFGPGFIAAYVYTLNSEGLAKANQWAKKTAGEIRAAITAQEVKPANPIAPLEPPK